jgi:hypothetical protein
MEQGDLRDAMDSYQDAKKIYEEQGNEKKVAGVLNNIGMINQQ